MALYKVLNPNSKSQIGIWELTESIEELYQQINLTQKEMVVFEFFKNDRRRIEWLATRALLKCFGEYVIAYHDNGRPYLENSHIHISISHTKGWVVIALNEVGRVGIDVEVVSEKAYRSRSKFVRDVELKPLDFFIEEKAYYTLIWACKEAIFKKYSYLKSLEFKKDILLAIEQGLNDDGIINYSVHLDNRVCSHFIEYFFFEGSVLVYDLND